MWKVYDLMSQNQTVLNDSALVPFFPHNSLDADQKQILLVEVVLYGIYSYYEA